MDPADEIAYHLMRAFGLGHLGTMYLEIADLLDSGCEQARGGQG